ncbi:Phosphatidylinositol 4-phosphate 5-kinase 5 [Hondaea fermentalgiana]|uniref:Phosphatidylinositol 4-phosphate 5-kinase 5 n=1 Tax=Hondaea fermentalgiana TaxID=2315210 RepID=A0A2R5G574_9STRA|nr:Phosphatidylinositol 4-phosphate 5-kinase 5 [Hondaea fermentalgiana]|eukprot:GBG25695.1 Phosphatidylinositol 4-phosphate 5-kinase 5 [Hondaea fermentalgiana]
MGVGHSSDAEGGTRRHTYPSGNVYEGQWKRNKRHGRGTLTWTDGTTYTGDWRHNKQEGFGVMRFRNGNVYEGEFEDNNFSGQGTLRTSNGEIVAGQWEFLGRSNSSLTSQYSVVGKYRLNVTITDCATDQQQGYSGLATVHLDTGLVVLPNMPSPDLAVMPYVVAVAAETNETTVDAVATPVTAAAAEARVFNDQAALEQRLINAEEHEEMATAPVASGTSVAYGVHDPALDSRPLNRPPSQKVEVFNPRNYF